MKIIYTILLFLFTFNINAQSLTIGEIYDFNIGDEWIIETDRNGPPSYSYNKILQRENYGSDSVKYQIFKRNYFIKSNPFYWIQTDTTIFRTFKNLNLPYFKNFLTSDSTSNYYDTITKKNYKLYELKDSIYNHCNLLVNERLINITPPLSEHETKMETAIKGIGVLKMYNLRIGRDGIYEQDYLKFYKKGTDSCGSRKSLPNSITTIQKNVLQVFPNPVSTILHFKMPINGRLNICNLQGKIIVDKEINDTETIDISELNSGFYFMNLKTKNDEIFTLSFVKN